MVSSVILKLSLLLARLGYTSGQFTPRQLEHLNARMEMISSLFNMKDAALAVFREDYPFNVIVLRSI